MLVVGRIVNAELKADKNAKQYVVVDVLDRFGKDMMTLRFYDRDITLPVKASSWEGQSIVAAVKLDRPYQDSSKVQYKLGGVVRVGPEEQVAQDLVELLESAAA